MSVSDQEKMKITARDARKSQREGSMRLRMADTLASLYSQAAVHKVDVSKCETVYDLALAIVDKMYPELDVPLVDNSVNPNEAARA